MSLQFDGDVVVAKLSDLQTSLDRIRDVSDAGGDYDTPGEKWVPLAVADNTASHITPEQLEVVDGMHRPRPCEPTLAPLLLGLLVDSFDLCGLPNLRPRGDHREPGVQRSGPPDVCSPRITASPPQGTST